MNETVVFPEDSESSVSPHLSVLHNTTDSKYCTTIKKIYFKQDCMLGKTWPHGTCVSKPHEPQWKTAGWNSLHIEALVYGPVHDQVTVTHQHTSPIAFLLWVRFLCLHFAHDFIAWLLWSFVFRYQTHYLLYNRPREQRGATLLSVSHRSVTTQQRAAQTGADKDKDSLPARSHVPCIHTSTLYAFKPRKH